MAMIQCKECKAKVSDKAKTCPQCGAVAPKKTSRLTILFAILLALVSIPIIKSISTSNEREAAVNAVATSAANAEKTRIAALSPDQLKAETAAELLAAHKRLAPEACKIVVAKSLKDPDSAKWEEPWATAVKVIENGKKYSMQVEVRAKNSFGGYGLSRFTCILAPAGDLVIPVSIKELK
jgi:hypothetical protein